MMPFEDHNPSIGPVCNICEAVAPTIAAWVDGYLTIVCKACFLREVSDERLLQTATTRTTQTAR